MREVSRRSEGEEGSVRILLLSALPHQPTHRTPQAAAPPQKQPFCPATTLFLSGNLCQHALRDGLCPTGPSSLPVTFTLVCPSSPHTSCYWHSTFTPFPSV